MSTCINANTYTHIMYIRARMMRYSKSGLHAVTRYTASVRLIIFALNARGSVVFRQQIHPFTLPYESGLMQLTRGKIHFVILSRIDIRSYARCT